MSARSLTACLTVAGLLAGTTGRTNAKPPDLPACLKVMCQPEGDEPSEAAPAPCPYTCPYLRQKEMEKRHPHVEPAEPATTLENLEKLEQAETILGRAERHREAGRPELARACYERVRRLCPGSRYDRMATARLRELKAGAPAHPLSKSGGSAGTEAGARREGAAELDRGLAGLLESGCCLVEIGKSPSGGLRAQCGITLGGLMIRLVADERPVGQCCVVRFLPSPLGELCTLGVACGGDKSDWKRRPDSSAGEQADRQDAGDAGCETEGER